MMAHTLKTTVLAALVSGALLVPLQGQAQSAPPRRMKAQAMAIAKVCHADFERLCGGIAPGGGRVLVCLQAHADTLTPKCREALPEAQSLKTKAAQAGVLPKPR